MSEPYQNATKKVIMDEGPWAEGGTYDQAAEAAANFLVDGWVDEIENEDTAEHKLPALLEDIDRVVERLQLWKENLLKNVVGHY